MTIEPAAHVRVRPRPCDRRGGAKAEPGIKRELS